MNDTGSLSARVVDDTTSETEILPFNLKGARRLLFWWGIWTFLGLLQAARLYVVYNFKGGPAPIPDPIVGDVNCSGTLTSSDIIYMVNFVFKGGPPPCSI